MLDRTEPVLLSGKTVHSRNLSFYLVYYEGSEGSIQEVVQQVLGQTIRDPHNLHVTRYESQESSMVSQESTMTSQESTVTSQETTVTLHQSVVTS